MNQQLRPSQIVIMASGGVMFLLGSFLPFYSASSRFGGSDWTAWTSNFGIFPLATYMLLIGLAMAVLVALTAFANVKLPPQVLSFTWTQIYLILAVFAGLLAVGFLMAGTETGFSWGAGFWILFLGSAGLIVGAVMQFLDEKKGAVGGYPGQQPPPPGPPPAPPQ